jgi:GT2 family glycosyltransferase
MLTCYVVIVNWNGWKDTCACLESVFSAHSPTPCVIVCDNASTNDSIDRIRAWANGNEPVNKSQWPILGPHFDSAPKPFRLVELTRAQAESGDTPLVSDIYLIHTGANLGFAGGCNVGLRLAMARGDADYVWLLNNDTVVDPGALNALIGTAISQPGAGLIGSTLLYFYRPDLVQAMGGGTFSACQATTQHIGEGSFWRGLSERSRMTVQQNMSYVVGASMLVTRTMLDRVGLMQEDYFLYYEEIDWAERARRISPPFSLGYAADSIVYHKEGASAGTNSGSLESLRWLSQNRLRFIKRFYPRYVLLARIRTAIDGLKYLIRGSFQASWILLNAASKAITVETWKDIKL